MNAKEEIVFVHTPCYELEDDRLEPPLGILYLATVLKNEGAPVRICDLSGVPEFQWLDRIPGGGIYAFSTYSVTYHRTLAIRDLIKKEINPQAITIAGGPHVSALPKESSADFDIIITNEAETTFLKIIKNLKKGKSVKGIFFGNSLNNLNELPFPDYDLVDIKSYNRLVEGKPGLSLISSRGCPYDCTFCNSCVFAREEFRFRTPRNIVKEILKIQDQYGISNFRFSDDLFTFSPKRIEEMTAALKPLNIIYRIFARSNSLTNQATGKLFESGCRHLAIGIESMSSKMLSLLKKGTTVEANINSLMNARAAGLKTRIYLLIGFPGETKETIKESLDILLQCEFDEFVIYPFIPYPGTAIWENPGQWGAKIDRDFSKYVQVGRDRRTCYVVTTKDFTPGRVRDWRLMMVEALEKNTKSRWASKLSDNR